MQCLRSRLSALSPVLTPASLRSSKLTPYDVTAHHMICRAMATNMNNPLSGRKVGEYPRRPAWRATGETGTPSLHGDIATPDFQDVDRVPNWRRQTDKYDRNATNNLPGYMIIGVGSGVTLYLAKYTLYGLILLMGPGRDAYAAAAIEVELNTIPEGKNAVFTWRGKPLFIRHRSPEETKAAQSANLSKYRDPEPDSERCTNENFLIVLGVCTHLGCVPIAHAGDWKGYYCPCHGSHYDTSGRIMKGPAPLNLEIPKHEYISDEVVVVGKED